ncbi:MAG: carbohydrate porin, partial [Betaproteobacteria bacterium]
TGTAHDGHSLSGMTLFLHLTRADRRTSFLDNQMTAGAFFNGLFSSRPKDVLGIAFARTHVNTRAADAQRLSGDEPIQHSEYASELFYEVHTASWLTLRPNLQYLHDPGGRRDDHDAIVIALKSTIEF